MSPVDVSSPEQRIKALYDAGDLRGSATLLLETYGPEIYGFLASRLRDPVFTSDVFGDFTEDLWRSFKSFHFGCSARVWAYTLARHAASRGIRRRRRARDVPLSRAGPLSAIADRVRSETSALLQTTKRHRIAALRDQLPEFEQMLLLLRVNRQLAWLEIARIVAPGSPRAAIELDAQTLHAEAARLRKRFQKAKAKLRRLAEEAGLLTD
jgi:RNA polymerase sigma-70 factor (ECF subfamily)